MRLRAAFAAVLTALRRELMTSTTLAVRERPADSTAVRAAWIAIADPEQIDAVLAADEAALGRSTNGAADAA